VAIAIKRTNAVGNLSLTSMIDVVFLLLIFFLVTSEYEDEEQRLKIVLPTASSATPMTRKPREIVIDVDPEGKVFLRGQAVELEELERLLTAAVSENPTNQSAIIRADGATSFQPVVSVMDICNRTGISDYSVTTREPPKE